MYKGQRVPVNSRVFWLGRETLLQVVLPVHLLLFGLMKSHRAEYLFFVTPPHEACREGPFHHWWWFMNACLMAYNLLKYLAFLSTTSRPPMASRSMRGSVSRRACY